MTDFRALCAELVNDLEEYGEAVVDAGVGWVDPDTRELLIRARALLAQPVAEEPTDKELWAAGRDDFRANCYPSDAIAYARTVLAKWGHQ